MWRSCVLILLIIDVIIGAPPEILKDLKSDNVKEQEKDLKKIQARSGKAYPCPHHQAPQDNIYSLVQAQTQARILNKPNYENANNVLETAASNSLAQSVTLNSHISVGGGGPPSIINQQHLPFAARPPAFNGNNHNNNNGYLPPTSSPTPATPNFNPNFHRPYHYETQQSQQNGYQYASAFNRFSNTQFNYQQQNQYQQQQQQQQNLLNYRPTQHFVNNNQLSNGAYANSFSHQAHGTQQQNFNGADLRPVPSVVQNSLDGQLTQVIQHTFSHASLDPTAEKHIYVHVPPEDLEEKSVHQQQFALPPPPAQKHYKIIFIKAPTYKHPNVAQLAAANAQQTEEKTLIYVLVKKPEEPSVEELQQIQETSIKHHKPEVYFIKYKTRKEGEELQNQLLQRGSLPGTSEFTDGGIDIRSGNAESSSLVSTSSSYATSAVSTPSSYLPPNLLSEVPLE